MPNKAEARIQAVLKKLTTEQVDELAPDEGEFRQIAEASMAWWEMLFASGIIRNEPRVKDVIAASLLVLGTLIKYTYALGVRRGQRQLQERKRA